MTRGTLFTLIALTLWTGSLRAAKLTGHYIEARTCDVWTGPCFGNSEENLEGKNAVIGWKVEQGRFNDVRIDGLSIVAVIQAKSTLGVPQLGAGKAVILIDERADEKQQAALLAMAKQQAGKLLDNVLRVHQTEIKLDACPCKSDACAILTAGNARVETRCLSPKHDKICGNESVYYPPLTKNVRAKAAMAVDHTYTGKELGHRWKDRGRRGAYVGSFDID